MEGFLLTDAIFLSLAFVVAGTDFSLRGQLKNTNMENQESTAVFQSNGQLDE